MDNKNQLLRNLPQVDEILNDSALSDIAKATPHNLLANSIREVIVDVRANVLNGIIDKVDKNNIVKMVIDKVSKKSKAGLRRLINATGTVLHTNLGRSIVSERAAHEMIDVAYNYSNLEYDVKKGERGDRQSHIEKIITELTGCEAAMVVNNNAAATMLVLAALAKGKEVIISRGELIEIGGSFRIPDVMSESGAILTEVGTTNKTKISDYKNAYKEYETAAIMKVHTSNYKILGFTEETTVKELMPLGKEYDIPVIYDMGNGLFTDLSEYGIEEPTVPGLIKDGADVILFSGDKLLGGPQAGIIIGKEKYISKMKKHPLARALRVDKFTIAALTATLFEYYDMKKAKKNIPILSMITASDFELKERAEKLSKAIKSFTTFIEPVKDQVGGGTAPTVLLDGYAVGLDNKKIAAEKMERMFREMEIPIICRITHDNILLDVRTIRDDEIEIVAKEINSIT